MAIDVTEATWETEVIQRSSSVPVVVDFWAEWCGPCRTLGPVLEKAAAERADAIVLAKVDVDSNQGLSQRYGVQGIPAVKAFRDGAVASEFVGAQPPAAVSAFLDALLPSQADVLLQEGGEEALRRALDLEPARVDAVLALARILLERDEAGEAAELLERVPGDFEAAGLLARIRLSPEPGSGVAEALERLDSGDLPQGIEGLLTALEAASDGDREGLRRAIVGALSELGVGDARAREYRRRLAAAIY